MEILKRTAIVEICAHRDAALAQMNEAIEMIAKGHALAEAAHKEAVKAHGLASFTDDNRTAQKHYRRIFEGFDAEASKSVFRKYLDARVWVHLVKMTGMHEMMDRTAKDEFRVGLCGDTPEFTEESAREAFKSLLGDANLIFQRGLARAFSDLDRRFKSHDAFKIGSRMVLTNVFDQWGGLSYYSRMEETINDVERVFAVLDGDKRPALSLITAIQRDRAGSLEPRQGVTENPLFKVKSFKNGNAHLWFKRDDLVEKANKILADYYGEVLPDAVPGDAPADLRSKGGELSKDLAFYPTPGGIITRVLSNVYISKDMRVLEPSAGTGNMVRAILAKGARVDAIEVHPGRVRELEAIDDPRLTVMPGNFLRMLAQPAYDAVIMNPPFYGTHWMQHVTHAFDFLAPSGKLRAVLPVTAQVHETKKHLAFRAWAHQHSDGVQWSDLPPESFVESGTRVNTVVLTLRKPRA